MKYLKKFETTIKHNDSIALNHPLRNFSRKLEDIVILLKELDNFDKSTVRRYFMDDEKIYIIYKHKSHQLLKICLQMQSEMIHLLISETSVRFWNKGHIENSLDFFDFVDRELREYRSENYEPIVSSNFTYARYIFPINKMNDILNDLSAYESYIDSTKYNL